jgi:hypothetical protein
VVLHYHENHPFVQIVNVFFSFFFLRAAAATLLFSRVMRKKGNGSEETTKRKEKKRKEKMSWLFWFCLVLFVVLFVCVLILLHAEMFTYSNHISIKMGAYQWTSYDPFVEQKKQKIPKQIFFFWHSARLPTKIKIITDHWKVVLKEEWKIIQLHSENLDDYIPKSLAKQEKRFPSVQAKADWIRLQVLERHGGVWMDASLMLHSKTTFEALYERACRDRVDLCGFQIDYLMTTAQYPILENWCLIAPAHSPFLQDWICEYDFALKVGFDVYKQQRIQQIDAQHLFISKRDTYLTQHLCAQFLFQTKQPQHYRLLLERAEDHMFRIHQAFGFVWLPGIANRATDPSALQIPYIKLRKGDRMFVSVPRLKKLYHLH